ncbi:hypothetical protein CEXT_589391 [Caerostris extrusa]|uniref:Uncharacterized protein n=1 Tax=Caerostris extrusa TaxID=172846 RepID=A0AAV4QIA0_CAEEX|nr:hypothetical protein CEXT_589391 [Caerostris extrusa]
MRGNPSMDSPDSSDVRPQANHLCLFHQRELADPRINQHRTNPCDASFIYDCLLERPDDVIMSSSADSSPRGIGESRRKRLRRPL